MGMISLLNFIDTGFIITLGLLFLVSGAVMLYSYRRLNVLENSLIEHGKILQNFIVNYNNQILASQQNQFEDLNNSNKININSNYNQNKISVSDDDENNESDDENNESDDEYDVDENDESDDESDENDDENDDSDDENDKNDKVLDKENPEDVFLKNLPIDLNDLNMGSKII